MGIPIPRKFDLHWWLSVRKELNHALDGISVREFNLLYRSSQPAVVVLPAWLHEHESFLPLFCALKLMEGRRLVLYQQKPWVGETAVRIYERNVPKSKNTLKSQYLTFRDASFMTRYLEHECKGDTPPDTVVICASCPQLEGDFVENIVSIAGNSTHMPVRVIVMMVNLPESREWLDGSFRKKHESGFLYMDYPREREIVDDWYMRPNVPDTPFLLDPEFDIRLMEPGIDLGLVYNYLATNHVYDFRDYATFNRDEVAKYMKKEDLGHYIRRKPKWEKS